MMPLFTDGDYYVARRQPMSADTTFKCHCLDAMITLRRYETDIALLRTFCYVDIDECVVRYV